MSILGKWHNTVIRLTYNMKWSHATITVKYADLGSVWCILSVRRCPCWCSGQRWIGTWFPGTFRSIDIASKITICHVTCTTRTIIISYFLSTDDSIGHQTTHSFTFHLSKNFLFVLYFYLKWIKMIF